MKRETAVLAIVIAFLIGFISGATVAILRGTKVQEKLSVIQTPQTSPASMSPNSTELLIKIQSLKEIVKKDPKNLSAWVELGNLYFDTHQPKEAIEAYQNYLQVKPENADVRTDMGIMYRTLGDFDRALEEFKKAAQSDPKHLNSRYNIGIVLLHDKNDLIGAVQAWEDYLKLDSKSERAQQIKAQIENLKKMAKEIPKVSK
ncbi:MAG: tetratricopeptide repeat protein [Thermodesulfobacteriota bacterium]